MVELSKYISDSSLLKRAFTHISYTHEHPESLDYERLEFLGDAVLDLVITELLFQVKEDSEGVLTRKRASLVNEISLVRVSRALGFDRLIRLSAGAVLHPSMEADVVEAVIGAVFETTNYENAKAFIHKEILPFLSHSEETKDAKSILQELLQKQGIHDFHYELLEKSGPDHEPIFLCGLYIQGKLCSQGTGTSKKKAELNAAIGYLHESL